MVGDPKYQVVWIHTKMLPTVVDENSERIKKLIAKFKNAPEEPMIVEERVVREVEEEVAGPSRIVIEVEDDRREKDHKEVKKKKSKSRKAAHLRTY